MARHLSGFALGGKAPRVHLCDQYSQAVYEAGEGADGAWYKGELLGPTQGPAPSYSYYDAVASYGVEGRLSRIYYFYDGAAPTSYGQVAEIGWGDDGHWYAARIGEDAGAPSARPGSDIACFGIDGLAARVYYVGMDGGVIELAWQANATWTWSNISADIGAPAPDVDSRLVCFAAWGRATRLYYLDTDGNVVEIGWNVDQEDWYAFAAGRSIGAPTSGPQRSLTCFGVDGVTPRVYYATADGQIVELGIGDTGAWYAATLPLGDTRALDGAELACFGLDGATRLYFVDTGGNLMEAAWSTADTWVITQIDAYDPSGSDASSTVLLTGFELEGRTSALYNLTRMGGVIEYRGLGGVWSKTVRYVSR